MTQMQHNPPHPGEILQDTILGADGGITVTDLAARLGMARVTLSRVIHGHAAVTPEMAIRLERALGTSAMVWLRVQAAYDLAQIAKKRRPKIERIDLEHIGRHLP